MLDVVIVGGSYSGLSAALQLGRARRRVTVVDSGKRRNRFAQFSHGFLGQDGVEAGTIAAKGREQVLAYPSVTWREDEVVRIEPSSGAFVVHTGAGTELPAKRVILATGIVDELPNVPGIVERWGKTVFHCPYCHGYELDRGHLGVLATSAMAVESAQLVSEWAAPRGTTLFLNGVFEPDETQLAALDARGVAVERTRVERLGGDAPSIDVQLADGRCVALDGVFTAPRATLVASFGTQLGCDLEEGPMGVFYKTDLTKEATVRGIFACGDAALPMGSVALAVADGARAGTAAHRSLLFRGD